MELTRDKAWELLTCYNKEAFHLRHALTVEAVMGWFAQQLGYGDEKAFWSMVGLLHDLDFEQWPEEHCVKCQQLMRDEGIDERLIRAVASHGWGTCVDIQPEHEMEKVLFAVDELTRSHRGRRAHASIQKRAGYGAQVPEKEVQRQKVRRRLLTRGD